MKKALFLGTLLLGAALAAVGADALWTGGDTIKTGTLGTKTTGVAARGADGALSLEAVSGPGKVSYVNADLDVAPFIIGNKSLTLEVRSDRPENTVAFYVRGFAADGRQVISFQSWPRLSPLPQTVVLTPGRNDFAKWEPDLVNAPADTPIVRLRIIAGTKKNLVPIHLEVKNIRLTETPAAVQPDAVSEDLGIAARTAEIRSLIVGRDRSGKRFILCRAQDNGDRGYLLFTDVERGETTQYFNPEEVRQGDNFGSVLSSAGVFYYDQAGGHVLAFDTETRTTRYLGRPDPANTHFMVYTEAPDGKIYMGGFPRAAVSCYDPATGTFRDFGRMDPEEKYVGHIAADREGWVYAGIGTARANIVALNPATGEKIQLLPEAERSIGYGQVVAGTDGFVYGSFGDNFRVKLLAGKVVEAAAMRVEPQPVKAAKFGGRILDFGDGSKVLSYSIDDRKIILREADGTVREFAFDYRSGGVNITSLGGALNGTVYGSTSHPMHFFKVDGSSGQVTDFGFGVGGNFCAITTDGKMVYACEYPGGRLWRFDPAQPPRRAGVGNLFGRTAAELGALAQCANGYVRALGNPPVLFCRGDGDGATFTFPLPVAADGEYFLNLLLYKNGKYGTVKVECGGRTLEVNLQEAIDQIAPMINLGPFALKAGVHEVRFTVNRNPGGDPFFGIVALDFEQTARRDEPVKISENPRVLARWADLITRPRAVRVHPDGRHVIISGFANYGMTGGGFGIYELASGKAREIADWLPGHSCIAMTILPNGDIAGGTSITAPGGGHLKAEQAAIVRIDWASGKTAKTLILPDSKNVVAIEFWRGRIVAATAEGMLLFVDPESLEIQSSCTIAANGTPPRQALLKSADDRLFLLQRAAISEIDADSLRPRPFAAGPGGRHGITAGGAILDGYLYFASQVKVFRCRIPAAR